MDPAIPLRVALSALALLAFAGDVLIGPGPRGARWFSGHVLCAVALALIFAMSGGAGQSAEFALGWVVGWSVCLDLVIALAALSRAVVVPHAATVAVGAALLARSVLSFTGPGAAGRAVVGATVVEDALHVRDEQSLVDVVLRLQSLAHSLQVHRVLDVIVVVRRIGHLDRPAHLNKENKII